MRKKAAAIIILALLVLFHNGCAASKDDGSKELSVAVVRSKFDPIDKVLSTYRIPHTMIDLADIEKPETYGLYTAIFFPCGMNTPVHDRLSVHAAGRAITSVSINEDLHDLNVERAGDNIHKFINEGGAAYFSGYAFRPLQAALSKPFKFFHDFPYMGEEGRIHAKLKGDLAVFCGEEISALYMTHSGWIAIEDVSDGEVLSTATYNTPLGEKTGPISVLFREGKGEVIYTSYHNSVYSDFRRFNIYKIIAYSMIERSSSVSRRWGQDITASIGDAVHDGEHVRMYRLPVQSGLNNLYIVSEASGLQIDILDEAKHLIESRGFIDNEHTFAIDAEEDGHCFIRIFPQNKQRFRMYAVTMASGSQVFPRSVKIVILAIVSLLGLAAAVFFFLKLMDGFKYKTRSIRRF